MSGLTNTDGFTPFYALHPVTVTPCDTDGIPVAPERFSHPRTWRGDFLVTDHNGETSLVTARDFALGFVWSGNTACRMARRVWAKVVAATSPDRVVALVRGESDDAYNYGVSHHDAEVFFRTHIEAA